MVRKKAGGKKTTPKFVGPKAQGPAAKTPKTAVTKKSLPQFEGPPKQGAESGVPVGTPEEMSETPPVETPEKTSEKTPPVPEVPEVPVFKIPELTDPQGITRHCLTREDLLDWKYLTTAIIGSQEGALRRNIQSEKMIDDANRKAMQLREEAKVLTQDIHSISDDRKRLKAKLHDKYGYDFLGGGASFDIDTGMITKILDKSSGGPKTGSGK